MDCKLGGLWRYNARVFLIYLFLIGAVEVGGLFVARGFLGGLPFSAHNPPRRGWRAATNGRAG